MINWLKKNWIIGLLFIIVIFILVIKYKISNTVNQENDSQERNVQIIPTIMVSNTTIVIPENNEKIIGGLTIDQINELGVEDYDLFVDGLSEEEYNSLPPTKYPVEEYLDHESSTFKIISFDNNQLKVRSKIEDKIESENELNKWLKSFVEPINFNISWE